MSYQYRHTPTFQDCMRKYANDSRVKADVMDTLNQLVEDPFGPSLSTHRVKRAQGETFVSDVGGRKGKRLIWRRVSRTVVLLLVGEHDPVYRRAENLRIEIDDDTDTLRVFDTDPETGKTTPYAERRQAEGTLFMAWNTAELRDFGFEDHEIDVLRRLDSEPELLALEERMRSDAFDAAMNLYLYGHPEGEEAAEVQRLEREREESEAAEAKPDEKSERDLAKRLRRPSSRSEFAPVPADVLAEVLSKPIEDWMVFLHPDQASLAERAFSGPARVRGAAGTGKTVVGLHRAAHLARTYNGQILVTTFIRTLPKVLETLFARYAPDVSGRVEFCGLHSWALSYLHSIGRHVDVDKDQMDAAFNAAWSAVSPGSVLDESPLSRRYYREEVDWIIKGRDLGDLGAYLALDRTGRGTPLDAEHRQAVWVLYDEYERQLRKRKTRDFNDILVLALSGVREFGPKPRYASVIVDESQDLTEVGVRLAHAVAGGDKADGLVLLGDGQQSVYPGGYSLGSLGIDVRGRASVLRINYRNTREILEFARRIVEGHAFDDNEIDLETGDRDVQCLRRGDPPTVEGFSTVDDHDLGLTLAIQNAVERPGVGPGDVAVLVPTNSLMDLYAGQVSGLGLPTQKLTRYDGTPTDQVKVGTYQRAKGLEFKHVFLPRLEPDTVGEKRRRGEDDEAYDERIELLRRQLFVAATRARDGLWAGWVGEPTSLLSRGTS